MNETLLRELVPAVIGVLVRRGADFASAEDAVQEALIRALETWPGDPPRDPKGWLVTAAWRKYLDVIRAESSRRGRELAVEVEPPAGPAPATDDTLRLYFLCAHPTLPPASGGRVDAARGRRPDDPADRDGLPRPRGDHGAADQPGQAADRRAGPRPARRPRRRCCAMLYLVFNEGYGGDVDLAAEAIRLTRQLAALTDGEPEVAGLLALMLLHHARRASRTGPGGRLVPLAEQDRSRWEHRPDRRRGGRSCRPHWPATGSASTRRRPRSPPCTRTPQRPPRPTGCRSWSGTTSCCGSRAVPVVRLNRAVAVGEADGPRAGLAALAGVSPGAAAVRRGDGVPARTWR